MKLKSHWLLPIPALRCCLALALLFITSISALAQFDTLSDEDRCFLGQTEFCPGAPEAEEETEEKAENQESAEKETVSVERELRSNCPDLLAGVVVSGYSAQTFCQIVSVAGLGRIDELPDDIIIAVDVWGFVPPGVEVCFLQNGSLAFLDADYSPRELRDMEAYQRDGMTCGTINKHGTVVLFAASQPSSEDVAVGDCQIKVTGSLYLRAEPAGEILDIVWLHSEVPVLATNGKWFKVTFEGQTGYVTRRYHRVLRGNCG
ncbi:MAG: SH3 domain-containing protein [Chloroflexi bacterium]|nr:SH3 domain-containing protein [Chloroflexota bacterium]MCY3582577.1 SH3 domain-containing protein [Chloroflexota bacterium]MCY3717561.1 SH3 domain-containing protein [Chloroflexota bacterium]MDE2650269.1 SH3 domain-containing protein [Chloroflexota bacterium]MXV92976.1 SH3 domain-containing protein [Chloroflexota bacterium]